MARMTLNDMKSEVRFGLGGETVEVISDNRITRYINQAYMDICSAYPIPELEDIITVTTASGTAEYELDSPDGGETLVIDDVVDTTGGLQLQRIRRRQYNEYTQGTATTGSPVYYFVSGVGSNGRKNITFFPTPSGINSVKVYIRLRPDELVSTPIPTSPILQETWDDVIVQLATARGWLKMGDYKMAAAIKAEAKESIVAAKKISMRGSQIPTYIGSIIGRATYGK